MTNIEKPLRNEKSFRKFILCSLTLILCLTCLLPVTVHAGWDGSGDSSGGNAGGSASSYSVPNGRGVDNVIGYRFTVFNGSGSKVGWTIDIDFRGLSSGMHDRRVRGSSKKSHIQLNREMQSNGHANIGTPSTSTSADSGGYRLYDSSLPHDPSSLQNYMSASKAKSIAFKCGVANFGMASNFLIAEPIFEMTLNGTDHLLTIVEAMVSTHRPSSFTARMS